MALVFCFLAHHPSSLELLDYLKAAAVYIAMLPKPVFRPSGGLFHLYLRYWPQSILFIILMRFIDGLFICLEPCLRASGILQPALGPPDRASHTAHLC